MALIVAGLIAGGLYLSQKQKSVSPALSVPSPPGDLLPPMDIRNPAKNDQFRAFPWSYNPLTLGYTDRIRTNKYTGPYSMERFISQKAAESVNSPIASEAARKNFLNNITNNPPLHPLLDNNFSYKGLRPFQKIRGVQNPNTIFGIHQPYIIPKEYEK